MTDRDRGNRGDMLEPAVVADLLGVSEVNLRDWRHLGVGPEFHRYNRNCVRYDRADVLRWKRSKRVRTLE